MDFLKRFGFFKIYYGITNENGILYITIKAPFETEFYKYIKKGKTKISQFFILKKKTFEI